MAQIFQSERWFQFPSNGEGHSETPLVHQWHHLSKWLLQKHLHSTKNAPDSCIHRSIYNLFTHKLCFFSLSISCRGSLQSGPEDCNVSSTDSYSAHVLPSALFFFLSSVFLLFAPTIHPCPHFVLLTRWLMFTEDKHTPFHTHTIHTHTLIHHTAPNSPLWMGLTSHPVARTTEPTRGNLLSDKRVCEGPTLLPTSHCLSWAPKLPCDDTTHTPLKLWFICRCRAHCDVTSLPFYFKTTHKGTHTPTAWPAVLVYSYWTLRWVCSAFYSTLWKIQMLTMLGLWLWGKTDIYRD